MGLERGAKGQTAVPTLSLSETKCQLNLDSINL